MSAFSGDFLGFQLGDIHSSLLNITRVSASNRYSENIIPNFSDSTAQVPGGDGLYYWNTFYTQKPFTIDFAFDDLRDEDLRKLRQVFGFKGVKELIFDEMPYKKYMVKCSAPPTLKYIAFDYQEVRVYKGEGSVNLVAYYPFALSISETVFKTYRSDQVISNVGDMDIPFKIIYPIGTSAVILTCTHDGAQTGKLIISGLAKIGTDSYYAIDTKTNLVEGLNSSLKKTGHLYNRYITEGDFFKLPVGISTMTSTATWSQIRFNTIYY